MQQEPKLESHIPSHILELLEDASAEISFLSELVLTVGEITALSPVIVEPLKYESH